jgi:ABC-2 type transport system ATP-binding protein
MELLCDRIGLLYGGKIKDVGTPEQLKKDYSKETEIQIQLRDSNQEKIVKELKRIKSIREVKQDDKRITVLTIHVELTLEYVLRILRRNKQSLVDLTVKEPTLQEAFKYLLGRGGR